MWAFIARSILRNRILILVILGVITAGLGYQIKDVHIAFGLPRLLPDDDPNWEIYQEFKDRFKSESTVFVIGLEEDPLENMALFNAWYDLGKRISSIDGVDTVLSVASVFNVYKDTVEKRFAVPPIVSQPVQSEAELDSIRGVLYSLPFYRGLLYNDTNSVNLMGVSLNNERFNSENRGPMLDLIVEEVEGFQKAQNIQVRLSGLPYIRTVITSLIKSELNQFIAMAVGVTVLILFFFFRSIKPVLVSMLVVGLGVVWSMGTMGLFNYEISILTSIIPPLIIVIGIPNCIFLINKYHSEYRMHGNQAKALTRVVQKIGKATFLTNVTTATGFLTFIFTQSDMLVEFGIIASLNIFLLFVLSLLIITIVFSYLSAPKPRHTQHLETRWVRRVVDALNGAVDNHRKWVYVVTVITVLLAFYGISMIETTGNVVDDLPDDHPVSQDLRFIEQNFNGIMPFEVMIDTRRPNGVTSAKTLRNIDRMQDLFVGYPQFSKPVSIVEGIKFTKQAFYNGDPEKYTLISNQEKAFFKDYLDNAQRHERFLDDFIDSTQRYTRVSMNMADIGTAQMDVLLKDITRKVDSIFNPKKPLADSLFALLEADPNHPPRDSVMLSIYKRFPRVKRGIREAYQADSPLASDSAYWEALAEDPAQINRVHDSPDFTKRLEEVLSNQFYRIDYTGQATVFLKGTNYLVKNLFVSLSIAVVIVALIMAIFFASFRMIVISLVTNLIPLLLTAGLMGYFQIAIKPSTILVFSVAFGISVDDTIHFLAKYRQELKYYNHNIGPAVVGALRETGVSMMYTSVILFFGFSVFDSSEFGGTQALGLLVSFTLLVAMLANLVLLPSFLLSLEKAINARAYREPFLQVMDEEEDIELDDLRIDKIAMPGENGMGTLPSTDQESPHNV